MPEEVDDDVLADASDEVSRVKAEHADLIARVAAGKLSATLAVGAEPGILARLKIAEKRVSELATPVGLHNLIDPGPQAVESWKKMPREAQREVMRLLFASGVLGVLSVAPFNGKRGPRPLLESRIRLNGLPLLTDL